MNLIYGIPNIIYHLLMIWRFIYHKFQVTKLNLCLKMKSLNKFNVTKRYKTKAFIMKNIEKNILLTI